MLDWNPQYDPYKYQRAMAIDKHRSPTLTNAFGTSTSGSVRRAARGAAAALAADADRGTYTGQGQAGVERRQPTATTPCWAVSSRA